MQIAPVTRPQAEQFIREHHYQQLAAPITCHALGLWQDSSIVGVATWGYGTRPLHTIRKLFPSLVATDYLELGRFCLHPDLPHNSESQFLAMNRRWLAQHSTRKLLYTWADGLRGKCGYIYQADNWLYGGFIRSEYYLTKDGKMVHPRYLITRYGTRAKSFTEEMGLTHVWGYQFRYCYFLCSRKERKRLLAESTVEWARGYPKDADLKWWYDTGEGPRESSHGPAVDSAGQFRTLAPYTIPMMY